MMRFDWEAQNALTVLSLARMRLDRTNDNFGQAFDYGVKHQASGWVTRKDRRDAAKKYLRLNGWIDGNDYTREQMEGFLANTLEELLDTKEGV